MMGASNVWWVPLANMFGRRPVLLAASLLMVLASAWGGLAGASFGSLLAARIVQGIGAGPSETIAPALVGEVYFVDERGRAMAVYTCFLSLGSLVGGIAGGYLAHMASWAWNFWASTILSAFLFLGFLLFVPETMFNREEASTPSPSEQQRHDESSSKGATDSFVEDATAATTTSTTSSYRPYTFVRSLGFARPRTASLLQPFLQPWRTLALPGTWVVMLHYAGLVGGIVTISTVGAQLVQQPPYLWGANAGLVNLGGLVGVVLGALYTYFTSDARLLGQARHEGHGYAEPENRLPTMFPSLAIGTGGFFVFGFCAQYPGANRWVGLEVGYAMVTFGLMQVPSIGFNYVSFPAFLCLSRPMNKRLTPYPQLIDSYSHLAGDCFVAVCILRSIIAFAWTFFVSEWISSRGAAEPFGIFGMLMGLFSLLIVPLWVYGKRMRVATAGYVLDG